MPFLAPAQDNTDPLFALSTRFLSATLEGCKTNQMMCMNSVWTVVDELNHLFVCIILYYMNLDIYSVIRCTMYFVQLLCTVCRTFIVLVCYLSLSAVPISSSEESVNNSLGLEIIIPAPSSFQTGPQTILNINERQKENILPDHPEAICNYYLAF